MKLEHLSDHFQVLVEELRDLELELRRLRQDHARLAEERNDLRKQKRERESPGASSPGEGQLAGVFTVRRDQRRPELLPVSAGGTPVS